MNQLCSDISEIALICCLIFILLSIGTLFFLLAMDIYTDIKRKR